LNSLKDSKITSFSLTAFGIIGKKSLASLASFLKNSSQSLVKNFSILCKEINQLKNLRHLKLSINTEYEEEPVKNFFQTLFPLTRIQTLHLSSNLLDSEKAFSEIMKALKSLSPTLLKMTLIIGDPLTGFLTNISSLLNKKGLRKFSCNTEEDLYSEIIVEIIRRVDQMKRNFSY